MRENLNTPKVSVCVITYNQEKYIRQCLQSIVEQKTNFVFEIIVGDDCSSDGTRNIIKEFAIEYPDIIKPIYQDKNINNGSYNYLTVHQAATGQYVAHIDGDDLMHQGKLQAQSDLLDSNRDCTAVWHRVDFFDDMGNFCSGHNADLSPFKEGFVHFDDVIRLGYVSVHSSLMYRRSARSDCDIYSHTLDVYRTWDLLSSGHGFILNEVLGAYRVRSSGSISTNSHILMAQLAIEHANHFLKKFPYKRKLFFIFALTNALILLKSNGKMAMKYLMFAIRTFSLVWPWKITNNILDKRSIQVKFKYSK